MNITSVIFHYTLLLNTKENDKLRIISGDVFRLGWAQPAQYRQLSLICGFEAARDGPRLLVHHDFRASSLDVR